MTCFTSTLAATLLTASVSAVSAQTSTGATSQTPAGAAAESPATASAQFTIPRVELGASLGLGVALAPGDPGAAVRFLPGARVSTAINPRWALEGVFDVMADDDDLAVIYRIQARWRFRSNHEAGTLRTHLTFGTTGGFEHSTWGPSQWRDATGTLHQEPRRESWSVMPPILPTVGIGLQKTLGAHLALRADLAAIVVPADDFIGVLLMPSVSVSIPIGRYTTARAR
jgi:hypothetical protein